MRRLLFWLHRFEDGLIVTVLLGMVLLAVAQIGLRNFGGVSLVWAEPLLRNAVLWIGLLGAMIASRKDEHIRIDLAANFLPERWLPWVTGVVDLFTAGICVLTGWYSVQFVIEEYQFGATAFAGVPSWLLQAVIPLGFTVMALRYLVLFGLGLRGRRPSMREPVA
ncbi:MAG TPA: TRAP transporter small permease [Alcanivorax sp.]|jgi:C4-dicarboxylate transporter DctQ subunit|nr:TRAP transporter small permease [Alcanivorax sp.]HCD75819.1 TRAP transporter small permease [Alcanivorax sp.]HCK28097.1 TRAP transporter small permease [Alcanivorax sp.]|tara:strand:+ start:364 stop:858 length:495 start_codon:yes stop_codon:yes gene_type:complete